VKRTFLLSIRGEYQRRTSLENGWKMAGNGGPRTKEQQSTSYYGIVGNTLMKL
jgi:hypothetical protein